jgi:hypothetical protein
MSGPRAQRSARAHKSHRARRVLGVDRDSRCAPIAEVEQSTEPFTTVGRAFPLMGSFASSGGVSSRLPTRDGCAHRGSARRTRSPLDADGARPRVRGSVRPASSTHRRTRLRSLGVPRPLLLLAGKLQYIDRTARSEACTPAPRRGGTLHADPYRPATIAATRARRPVGRRRAADVTDCLRQPRREHLLDT